MSVPGEELARYPNEVQALEKEYRRQIPVQKLIGNRTNGG